MVLVRVQLGGSSRDGPALQTRQFQMDIAVQHDRKGLLSHGPG
jgi:hypothetical protein